MNSIPNAATAPCTASDRAGGGQPDRDARRNFLKGVGASIAGAGIVGSAGFAPPVVAASSSTPSREPRRAEAYKIRHRAALAHLTERTPPQPTNGDEERYVDKRASFTKGLPHNALGEVDLSAYAIMTRAIASGRPEDFDAIPLAPMAVRKLVNPQCAYAFDMMGTDSHATGMPAPPQFASAEAAAEVGEVYWMALLRDIPYRDYASNSLVAAAVADLNAFSVQVGPTQDGSITPETLFRGPTPGDLAGPYLSQFLWKSVPYGPSTIVQRYVASVPGESFVTDLAEWLAIQQGAAPSDASDEEAMPRYISNMRVLAAYVHKDAVFQAFLNAAMIIAGFGARALDPANPYVASRNQAGFVTFGDVHVLDLVTKAARIALEAAWYQKWPLHRRLRPEVFGGRIEMQRLGIKGYGVHADLMECDAVALTVDRHESALLPQVFPEGSPLHPAYPSGHASLGGACITMLKAFYDEGFVIPSPVQASADGLSLEPWGGADLTLGNELNKLATNISAGRCAAGIHYRSDNRGITLGESVAIAILQDYSLTCTERFDGFTLTKLDGQRIRIANGSVQPA